MRSKNETSPPPVFFLFITLQVIGFLVMMRGIGVYDEVLMMGGFELLIASTIAAITYAAILCAF